MFGDDGSAIVGIFGATSALLLLLLPLLGVDEPSGKRAFGPVGLIDVTRALASGSHFEGGTWEGSRSQGPGRARMAVDVGVDATTVPLWYREWLGRRRFGQEKVRLTKSKTAADKG